MPIFAIGTSVAKIIDIDMVPKSNTQAITTTAPVWTDVVGLTLTFTPENLTDQFIIAGELSGGTPLPEAMFVRILRIIDPTGVPVETPIGRGDAAGDRTQTENVIYPADGGGTDSTSWIIRDSPNTLFDVLYKVQVTKAGFNAATVYVNRSFVDTDNSNFARSASALKVTHKRA